MENLPSEMILEQLLRLSIAEISMMCQTNQTISNVCQQPLLWKKLLERDYPQAQIQEGEDFKLRYRKEDMLVYLLQSYPQEVFEYDLVRSRGQGILEYFSYDEFKSVASYRNTA